MEEKLSGRSFGLPGNSPVIYCDYYVFSADRSIISPDFPEFRCYLAVNREFDLGDGFVQDCQHSHFLFFNDLARICPCREYPHIGLLLPYEPPFTDIAPTVPERVFDEGRVVKLVRKIEEISESVVA
jgi:hypothetical protein